MATAPTSPATWTALPAADPAVGPDVAYLAANNGTYFCVPSAPGAFAFTNTAITPNVSEITWETVESADATMGPMLWGSIDTDKALALVGGVLHIVEGA